jgi:DNA-directed RNA polymerase subunit RPC12/RpoP
MALKVRCSECRKKISVDEAFAGSMCRCPYCKSIVMVPAEVTPEAAQAPKRSSRPTAPGASRPKMPSKKTAVKTGSDLSNIGGSRPIIGDETPTTPTPSTKIATPKPTPSSHEHVAETTKVNKTDLTREQLKAIPTANPVRMQGIATLLMLLVLLIMVAASIFLATQLFNDDDDETGGSYIDEEGNVVDTLAVNDEVVQANPFMLGKNGSVAGESVAGPVLYVIDAGTQMGELYAWGRAMVRASIRTLPAGGQFGVIAACDPEPVLIGGKLLAGGPAGDEAIKIPMGDTLNVEGGTVAVGGASDLPGAITKAITHEPKTIVLICSKKGFDSPDELGKLLADKSIKLILISMKVPGDEELEQMEALVKAAGNGSALLQYEARELGDFHDESDIPE